MDRQYDPMASDEETPTGFGGGSGFGLGGVNFVPDTPTFGVDAHAFGGGYTQMGGPNLQIGGSSASSSFPVNGVYDAMRNPNGGASSGDLNAREREIAHAQQYAAAQSGAPVYNGPIGLNNSGLGIPQGVSVGQERGVLPHSGRRFSI